VLWVAALVFGVGMADDAAAQAARAPSCPDPYCNDQSGYYSTHASCRPSNIPGEALRCSDVGPWANITGGLYTNYELHYNVIMSARYAARLSDLTGYQCATNLTQLRYDEFVTPWGGVHGPNALDCGRGFDRCVWRRCEFPDLPEWPFLCTFDAGNPNTCGDPGGDISYNSLFHDEDNHRWTVFAHCWNPATPQFPNRVSNLVTFNVFSLDPVLSCFDRNRIIRFLRRNGYNVNPSNLVEPDFVSQAPAPKNPPGYCLP